MAAWAILVAAAFVAGVWNATRSPRVTFLAAAGVAALLGIQHAAASSGLLREFDRRPPPLFLLIAGTVAVTLTVAFSRLGSLLAARTSWAWLIGIQSFRLPLELTMHRAASEGVMPVQMSYSGWNFDILTGLSALILALLVASGRVAAPSRAVSVWNAAGFLLLVNIVTIAIASLPLFAAFGPDRLNVWVAYPVFVWLPGVLVQAALLGHVLVWRKLKLSGRSQTPQP